MPHRRHLLAAAILLAAQVQVRAACPAAASVPLILSQNELFLPVMLNGSPAQMVLDTGAGITVISNAAAGERDIPHDFDHHADLGGVGGSDSILFIGQVDSLGLGELTLKHQSYPIVDMPQRAPDGTPAAGLLGADVLKHYDIEIDIPAGRLTLYQTSCGDSAPPWQDPPEPIDITLDGGYHVLTPFKLQGIEMTGVLDTGAGGFAVTARAALRTGLSQDDLAADPQLRGTGVNAQAWSGALHRFQSVQLGAARYTNITTEVIRSHDISAYDALIGQDSLLGIGLLRDSRVWISYRARQLYIQRASR